MLGPNRGQIGGAPFIILWSFVQGAAFSMARLGLWRV
jgi:hypothetical protein